MDFTAEPDTIQYPHSPMPTTEDHPPHGSVEHEFVSEGNPAANIDSTEQPNPTEEGNDNGEFPSRPAGDNVKTTQDDPFPNQFEKDETGPAYSASGENTTEDGGHPPPDVDPIGGESNDPETKELAHDQLQPGDFGVNIGDDGHAHGDERKENQSVEKELSDTQVGSSFVGGGTEETGPETRDESNGTANLDEKDKDTETSPETAELQLVSLEEGEFGYNPGKEGEPGEDTGENPEAYRTRRRLSHSEPPCHSAPKQPAVQKQAPKTGSAGTAETAELRRISLKQSEFGYRPGKDGEPGEDTGENPQASRTRRRLSHSEPPCHSAPKQPAVKKPVPKTGSAEGTAETAELRRISLKQSEFGYHPGKESEPGEDTGENPQASRTRRRLSHSEPPHHSAPKQPPSSKQTSGSRISPETKKHPEASVQAQTSLKTEELRTGAARARRRASVQSSGDFKEGGPSFGPRNPPRPRRSSQELGIEPEIHAQSCSPHITASLRGNAPRSESDTYVNDTLQSYLEVFLSERDSGTVSEHPKIHSSQAMEGAPDQQVSSQDRAALGGERHRKATVIAGVQQPRKFSSGGGTPITLDQLQQVLGQFKRDILDSINSRTSQDSDTDERHIDGNISRFGPRLVRIETDIDFIRKQISTNNANGPTDNIISQEPINSTSSGNISPRSAIASVYRRGKNGINWGIISLGVVAALSLVALGAMLGSARHTEKGWGDMLAEWLLKEGRGQKMSGI